MGTVQKRTQVEYLDRAWPKQRDCPTMENLIGDCVQGKQSQLILRQCQQEACARLKQLNGSGATRTSGLAAAEVHSHRRLESDPCHHPSTTSIKLSGAFEEDKVTERHEIKPRLSLTRTISVLTI